MRDLMKKPFVLFLAVLTRLLLFRMVSANSQSKYSIRIERTFIL